LISDALPFGHLWYGEPNAVNNVMGYANLYSRSHDAVIRVYDEAGVVIETHEQAGDFNEWRAGGRYLRLPKPSLRLKSAHNVMSTSIRNRLPGTIEQIVVDKVVSEIVINTAAGPVTSIITTGSVKRMNLKKGDAVFAIIKATEVSVESR
jgi:molybdopterin-binding protein